MMSEIRGTFESRVYNCHNLGVSLSGAEEGISLVHQKTSGSTLWTSLERLYWLECATSFIMRVEIL
jgi:hypothetical protein